MKTNLNGFLLSFILLLSSLSYGNENPLEMKCEEKYTSESPLLITDATDMGKREYENFRETMIPKEDNVSHFITKKSIVRLIRKPGSGEDYLNVEVLGEAKYNKPRSKGHFAENAYNKNLPQAMRGQKGFIHKDSLLPSDDFIFVVAKDSAFVALPSPYDEAKAFRIAKNGNKYKINKCCAGDDGNNCFDYPIFEVKLDGAWSEVGDSKLNARIYCGVTTDTRPIEKNQYEAVLNILAHPGLGLSAGLLENDRTKANANDLYFVDTRGLVMLPHLPAERGVTLTEGPYGSYHFTGGGQDIQGDDAYLAPYAACGFMAVMREWDRRYPDCSGKGCGITWGNCSHSTHVASVKGKWPSKTHGHGHCIDIRLFTKTSTTVGSSVYSKYYNRNRVVEFLQLARAAGATTIYLEDSSAARQVHKQSGRGFAPVLTRVPPHKDHMHVCFSHRSTESRSSFADPTLPATNSRLKNLCAQDAKDALAGAPSKLLGTDVVATAGIKTPDFILPENVPIPRPRPRPEGLADGNDPGPDADEPEVIPTIEYTRPVARPDSIAKSIVEEEIEVTTIDPPEVVVTEVQTPETVEIAPESESTLHPDTAEQTPGVALATESNVPVPESRPERESPEIIVTELPPARTGNIPLPVDRPIQEAPEPEVMSQPENDPFEEKPGDVTVADIIHAEIEQDQLVQQEQEKYYGEDLSEVSDEDETTLIEGDVVKEHTTPVPVEIEPAEQGLTLETEAVPSSSTSTNVYSDSNPELGYVPTSSGPSRRYANGRRPMSRPERDQGDDVGQAIEGAYEPVTTPEESSGFSFMSIFTGIFEAIANLFRGLFGG